MMDNFRENRLYIFMILFIVTPILVMIVNQFGIPSGVVWYIPNVIMFCVALKVIFLNIRNVKRKEYMLLAMFFLLAFVSCLLAYDKENAFFGAISVYQFGGFITFISYLGFFYLGTRLCNREKLLKLINIFLISSFVISLFVIMASTNNFNFYYCIEPFNHFNIEAEYLLIASLCSLFMFLFSKRWRVFYFVINFILLYALIINDTFGVYLSYFFVLILLFVFYIIRREKIKRLMIILLSFVLLSCVTYRNGFNVVYRNISGLLHDTSVIADSASVEDIYEIGTDRGKLWVYGTRFLLRKPLFGYGFDNVEYEYAKYDISQFYPHNLFLYLSLNNGIPAMIIYIFLIFSIIKRKIVRLCDLSDVDVLSLSVVFGYLFCLLFENPTFYMFPYFYLFLGILAQGFYKEVGVENEKK